MYHFPIYVAKCEQCNKEFPAHNENAIMCPGCGDLVIPEPLKKAWPELRPEEDSKLY